MIHLEINDADRILVVEMKGMVSEADIDGAIDALQAQYPAVGVHLRGGERGGFSMLADWQDLEGWEIGAKTLGTAFEKMGLSQRIKRCREFSRAIAFGGERIGRGGRRGMRCSMRRS